MPHRLLGLLFAAALAMDGCSPEYGSIPPEQPRAFRVPLPPSDSTLCLFSVPRDYDPARPWPLLVALHGYGSGAEPFHDLWSTTASEAGFVLVTPQGEERAREGYGWSWGERAGDVVGSSIDYLRRRVHIDPARISLIGFSQGGMLARRLALEHPRHFHGLALLGTPFRDSIPPGSLEGIRIYIGRGELEPDLDEARRAAATWRQDGCATHLAVYPGIGHGLPDPPAAELARVLAFLRAGVP